MRSGKDMVLCHILINILQIWMLLVNLKVELDLAILAGMDPTVSAPSLL